jgi:hypothetical protein
MPEGITTNEDELKIKYITKASAFMVTMSVPGY